MSTHSPHLSIIILNWNVADLLAGCLDSLQAACAEWWDRTEVVVVDNGSTDRSAEMVHARFPWARVLALPRNVGFTRGNNAGIRIARGEYLFLLNPDTVAHPGSIAALAGYLQEHTHTGIVGPRLLNPDGSLQSSRRSFPTLATALVESTPLQTYFSGSAVLRDFYMLDRPDDQTQEVGWLSGAALMCRREALQQAGLFDPGFFMFSEEVDLCRRVSDAGWRIIYLPHAEVTHFGGQSTGQDLPARHINFNTSKVRYFRLHEGPLVARLLRLYLLGIYACQIVSEAAKWLLGHKRPLRAVRLRLYARVLRSGLRERVPRPTAMTLFITGEYPPAQGGVGDYTCRLRDALLAQSFPVEVLTRRHEAVTNGSGRVTDAADVPLATRPITLRATLRALRGSGSRSAHIQYQTGAFEMRPTINLLPLLLRPFWRGKSLVTFHDLRVPYLFPKAGPVREWAVRALARGADACIATNPEDAARLRAWGIRHVSLIPIGSNIRRQPPEGYAPAAWRAARGIRPGTVLLAYFGFLNSTKGLADLLTALRTLKDKDNGDYRLLMVGGGLGSSDPTNRRTASELDALAGDLGVSDRLLWTGYLEPREVSAALLACNLAVLPYADGASFRRGSLLAVLAHGLPLVTTTPAGAADGAADWPRLEDGANALLVPPGDANALASAIERLAGDSALRVSLAHGALRLSRFFSWERIATLHIDLYRQLLGRGWAGGQTGHHHQAPCRFFHN